MPKLKEKEKKSYKLEKYKNELLNRELVVKDYPNEGNFF